MALWFLLAGLPKAVRASVYALVVSLLLVPALPVPAHLAMRGRPYGVQELLRAQVPVRPLPREDGGGPGQVRGDHRRAVQSPMLVR